MTGNESGLYPVMLRLAGKRCIVVGGGPVAERKVLSLLGGGADSIIVISDKLTDQLEAWGSERRIRIQRRQYQDGDLADASLVIAATNDSEANASIAAEAERLRIWVNTADDGELGNFVTPAVVRRGDLIVALTTGGASPAMAARLKKELEQLLGDDYEPRLRVLRLLRERLLGRGMDREGESSYGYALDPAKCRTLLRAAADDDLGWRSVAEQLPALSTSTDEANHFTLHTIELRDRLDQWIMHLSGQLA